MEYCLDTSYALIHSFFVVLKLLRQFPLLHHGNMVKIGVICNHVDFSLTLLSMNIENRSGSNFITSTLELDLSRNHSIFAFETTELVSMRYFLDAQYNQMPICSSYIAVVGYFWVHPKVKLIHISCQTF